MTELKWNPKKVSLRKVFSMFLALCICVTSMGINVNAAESNKGTLKLDKPTIELKMDGTKTAELTATWEAAPVTGTDVTGTDVTGTEVTGSNVSSSVTLPTVDDPKLIWTSSNTGVVKVEGSGAKATVTAVKDGTATITVSAEGWESATCAVTVKKADTPPSVDKPVAVNNVTLDKKGTVNVNKGKTVTVKATVAPTNATTKGVTWKSSNNAVAKITASNDGQATIKALKKGTATITATSKGKAADGKVKTATVKISVKVPATKVTVTTGISGNKIYVAKGKSVKVNATVAPSDTTDTIKVSTSKSSVATATVKNKVVTIKGKKAGTAKITVKAGSKKTTINVTVTNKAVKAKKVTLSKKTAKVLPGKTVTLTVKSTSPKNVTGQVTWKTSNKKVATVKDGVVTAKKAGTAKITATIGGKKATCTITVPGVTLNKTKATVKVKKSATIKIKKTIVKNDTIKKVATSNKKTATVSLAKNKKSFTVKGVKKGKATVTVTMKSGATAKVAVTVK